MLSDIEIAQCAKLKPIIKIAKSLGLKEKEIDFYGQFKAKIHLEVLNRLKQKKHAKYILVTGITPTPLGEGKTVNTIGLSMALNKIGKRAIACIRQPSTGPLFGVKGGAAGGGYSQVVPMEDFNLHFTGDIHAVSLAHNLAAAFLDNHLYHANKLNIDPTTISWHRVLDLSDRFLRHIKIGLGAKEDGIPRDSGFDIAVASEVMAILSLTNSLQDLRKRIGKIILAENISGIPITTQDLKVAGAMTVLLKEAIKPNLIQTLENTPVIVHTSPFGNIAHGNSSILADEIALRLSDYVVTEAGFGADCGAEKFIDIKCRVSGLIPDCVVIVCSIRALKMHSGKFKIFPGKPLDKNLLKENLEAVQIGSCNLIKQIENMLLFGVPVVICINKFDTDTQREIDLVKKIAKSAGAEDVVVSSVWENGSKGGVDFARSVVKASQKENKFKFLYHLDIPIKEKIKIIATRIYGAQDINYSEIAEDKIAKYTKLGYDNLPICIAKTHLSLCHDPNIKGRPSGFTLPVADIRASVGAGFLYALCGNIRTMPGLPSRPLGEKIDIDAEGNIIGLS